ncbi:MAG: glycosyltransferase family 2 protein [Methanoregula sp.]|nr:glycosyltransferase family 2 protein [Methanoregula sp.]
MKISIILPVLNEEGNIRPVYEKLCDVFSQVGYDYELLFVVDGDSSDRSEELITDIIVKDKNVRLVVFTRNFGHMTALIAGFNYCTGDAAITMDCDLQHPPDLIPELIRRWQEGYSIVNTIREDKNQRSIFKKYTSRYFYRIFSWLSEIPLESGSADFRLIDHTVLDKINKLEEHDIFLRGMIHWLGFNSTSVAYTPNNREYGHSKYNVRKLLQFAINGITSFSIKPLKLVTFMGFVISVSTFIYLIFTIYYALFLKIEVSGWASLMICVLFLGGIQLISIGILGEYVGKIFIETKKRPRYVIRHTKGF